MYFQIVGHPDTMLNISSIATNLQKNKWYNDKDINDAQLTFPLQSIINQEYLVGGGFNLECC